MLSIDYQKCSDCNNATLDNIVYETHVSRIPVLSRT